MYAYVHVSNRTIDRLELRSQDEFLSNYYDSKDV